VGSTRWPREYESAMEAETRAGKIVLTVGLYGHQQEIDMKGDLKKLLDNLHLHKIIEADEVLVLNRPVVECQDCGFLDERLTAVECQSCRSLSLHRYNRIGESTGREIAFARSRGKRVRFRYESEGIEMHECEITQLAIFKSGAMYEFRRTIYLPTPPDINVAYRGLIPGPTDEGEEFIRVVYDINCNDYVCELDINTVEAGHDLAAVVRFYGPDWTYRESTRLEPL
jgi:predicted Zn-ribbon and HTH transcriptional regulator